MTRKELDGLLAQYKAHAYGYESACSDEEALECEKGMQEVSEILWTRINALQFVPVSMPESFDDLVKMHGKDVIRDWLGAMLD